MTLFQTKLDLRFKEIGRKAPGDDWAELEMRLVPLQNVLKNMGISIERELLSGPYITFHK